MCSIKEWAHTNRKLCRGSTDKLTWSFVFNDIYLFTNRISSLNRFYSNFLNKKFGPL